MMFIQTHGFTQMMQWWNKCDYRNYDPDFWTAYEPWGQLLAPTSAQVVVANQMIVIDKVGPWLDCYSLKLWTVLQIFIAHFDDPLAMLYSSPIS